MLYRLEVNSDLTEGRGPMIHKGLFSSFEDALRVGEQFKIMGVQPDYNIYEEEPYTSVEDFLNCTETKYYSSYYKMWMQGKKNHTDWIIKSLGRDTES